MKKKSEMLEILKNIGGESVVWWIMEETSDMDFRYSKDRKKDEK